PHRLVLAGPDEGAGVPRGRGTRHAGVAPAPRTAEEPGRRSAQRVQGGGEFEYPVPAELVRVVRPQLRPPVADHLSLLAQRARDHGDLGTLRRVAGDGAAGGDGLVVRV